MNRRLISLGLGALIVLGACGGGSDSTSDTDAIKGAVSITPTLPPGATPPATAPLPTVVKPTVTAGLLLPRNPGDKTVTIIGLGDSYGSGEGNPYTLGKMDPTLFNVGNPREVWAGSPGGGLPPTGDERCHRSDRSGVAKAAALVKTTNPSLTVNFMSFACSGAESIHITTKKYAGTEDAINRVADILPQIDQAAAWAANKRVDIVYVSIGGNDAKFGTIVQKCFIEAPVTKTSCQDSPEIKSALSNVQPAIKTAISSVATSVRTKFPNAVIMFSAYPDPLSVDSSTPNDVDKDGICSSRDVSPTLTLRIAPVSGRPAIPELDFIYWISREDALFIRDTFQPQLNSSIRDAIQTFNTVNRSGASPPVVFIDDHYVNRSGNRGFCSASPIVNSNYGAAVSQGCDQDLTSFALTKPWVLQTPIGNFNIPTLGAGICIFSKGGWHPNDAGYELYANAIFKTIKANDARVRPQAEFDQLNASWQAVPTPPDRIWPTIGLGSSQFTFAWNDLSSNEDNYYVKYREYGKTVGEKIVELPAGSTTYSFPAPTMGSATFDISVQACHKHVPGGASTCSPWTATTISNASANVAPVNPTCTSKSNYGSNGGGCVLTFGLPQNLIRTNGPYAWAQVLRNGSVVASTVLPIEGGLVPIPFNREPLGSSVQFTLRVGLCSIAGSGQCKLAGDTPVSLTVVPPRTMISGVVSIPPPRA